jgi:dTDP-4-dehydrorhamnose reductase
MLLIFVLIGSANVKILITGATGQLGSSLVDTQPAALAVVAVNSTELDLTSDASITAALDTHAPDIIINAGAYTAVDKAESEPELAQRINGDAVNILADYCAQSDSKLIQVSTDFVFSGPRATPWLTTDVAAPTNVYGRTKQAGEQAAMRLHTQSCVLRTSWVYSEHGNNFVKTMLRLAEGRDELTVVDDQTGSPTYARNLAEVIWRIIDNWPAQRLLHYADAGSVTWRGFATEIFAAAATAGLLNTAPKVLPTTTAAYGAPAPRPPYTVLDTSMLGQALGVTPPPWRTALAEMLNRLPRQ